MEFGIIDYAVATSHYFVSLDDFADVYGVDAAKFHLGLGQDEFGVPAPDEDVVTMGADAARQVLERCGHAGVRTVLFASESSIDQSKAAGVFAHELLGLPSGVRVVELKQACYAGAAAVQAALGIVHRNPDERVLIVMSDYARYELDSPGEPTQGAGAVALLVGAEPGVFAFERPYGVFTRDINDFWRPNDLSFALVDGKLSIDAYLDALSGAWHDFVGHGGCAAANISAVCFHQPFTKMARKAQARLGEVCGHDFGDAGLFVGARYNRRLGNTYTASLFCNLAALLDGDAGLAGERLALFSYGSGCVAEFMTGIVRPEYFSGERGERVLRALDARVRLDVTEYRELHGLHGAGSADRQNARVTAGPYRFAGIAGRARRYEIR